MNISETIQIELTNRIVIDFPYENLETLRMDGVTAWNGTRTSIDTLTQVEKDHIMGYSYTRENQYGSVIMNGFISFEDFDHAIKEYEETIVPETDEMNAIDETEVPMNAVEFLKQELKDIDCEVHKAHHANNLAYSELYISKNVAIVAIWLKIDGKFAISSFSNRYHDVIDFGKAIKIMQLAGGITVKWESLHAAEETEDNLKKTIVEYLKQINDWVNTESIQSELAYHGITLSYSEMLPILSSLTKQNVLKQSGNCYCIMTVDTNVIRSEK